jgi:hypothetical protein
VKINKIANGDVDNSSKIYGNAFLGPNLWEKNDLFQGGVKFEHLEIEEFLNENGLNETDVEFLDQIQKIDALGNTQSIASAFNTSNTSNTTNSTNGTSVSPSSKSPPTSASPTSSSSSLSSVSNSPLGQAQLQNRPPQPSTIVNNHVETGSPMQLANNGNNTVIANAAKNNQITQQSRSNLTVSVGQQPSGYSMNAKSSNLENARKELVANGNFAFLIANGHI